MEEYGPSFTADKNFSLVQRLGHNVLKTGLRKISVAYSRISMADIAAKLQLPTSTAAEHICAKAIRDGVIEATIDHTHGWLLSNGTMIFLLLWWLICCCCCCCTCCRGGGGGVVVVAVVVIISPMYRLFSHTSFSPLCLYHSLLIIFPSQTWSICILRRSPKKRFTSVLPSVWMSTTRPSKACAILPPR